MMFHSTRQIDKSVREVAAAIGGIGVSSARPVLVAVDGRSGAGKSTLADAVQREIGAAVVRLDDFYTTRVAESEWPSRQVEQRLRDVFEWDRVRREALLPLRAGRAGRWRAFDFASGLGPDGRYRLQEEIAEVAPASVVLLDGAYSASPPLADLMDLAVLVEVSAEERRRSLRAREEAAFLDRWQAIWDEVEAYYFSRVRPRDSFDLVVSSAGE